MPAPSDDVGDAPKEPEIARPRPKAPPTAVPQAAPLVPNGLPNGAAPGTNNAVRKSSAPFPSPAPTDWQKPADLNHIRANTPLGIAPPHPPAAPQPPPPPKQQQPVVHHVLEHPIPRPTRSKSDASTKSGGSKTNAFKRMFGGGGGTNALPPVFLAPGGADDLNQNFTKLAVTPPTPVTPTTANGAAAKHVTANGNAAGPHTPTSERADPVHEPNDRSRDRAPSTPHRQQSDPHPQQRAPSRASSVKGDDTPTQADSRRTPSRPPSTDGRFNLKDLLGNGTKLSRKSSASSRRSDSSAGDNGVLVHGGYTSGPESVGGRKSRAPSSVGGDSATSLSKKYGVCERAPLGKGATSVVRLAHKWDRKEEKLYAVKEFRKRRKNETEREYVKKLTAEFCISSTLRHPNVVETVDLVQDEHQNWCEVMEYCPGGDLYAAIKRGGMSPSEVECCFKQMLMGIEYLHSQGVAHRDIKPENIFFDAKGQLKVGDYGASTVYRLPWESSIHMSTGLCGSEPYIAPEQFLGQPYDARLVDIWACGIVYYCLHFQELPWRAAQMRDELFASYVAACNSKNPSESECPSTINNLSPRACRPLLRRMLEPKPEKRILIEDVMKDSWLTTIEVCTLVAKPRHIHVHARQLTSGGSV